MKPGKTTLTPASFPEGFYVVIRPYGRVAHLSTDGGYTLCGHLIAAAWLYYDDRAAITDSLFAEIQICWACNRLAQDPKDEEARP